LFPHYGNVLGETLVQVFGPCFDELSDLNVKCLFDGSEVQALIVDENSVICISPALTEELILH